MTSYTAWSEATFGVPIPRPGVLFATSFEPGTEWGQKAHEALLNVEIAYVDRLLLELHQTGVPGAIAEFGIFKGWWINHLYEAADRIRMDRQIIGYDSFEGLSEPHPVFDLDEWTKGQFAASLEAVRANVRARERPRI